MLPLFDTSCQLYNAIVSSDWSVLDLFGQSPAEISNLPLYKYYVLDLTFGIRRSKASLLKDYN